MNNSTIEKCEQTFSQWLVDTSKNIIELMGNSIIGIEPGENNDPKLLLTDEKAKSLYRLFLHDQKNNN